ncbi:MAG: hypothetical protein ACI9SQ_000907 [Rubritalea sp.]|jgi:hypothetical protein
MYEVLLALGVGIVVGLIFSFLKLPLPAPPLFSVCDGGGWDFLWWRDLQMDVGTLDDEVSI